VLVQMMVQIAPRPPVHQNFDRPIEQQCPIIHSLWVCAVLCRAVVYAEVVLHIVLYNEGTNDIEGICVSE